MENYKCSLGSYLRRVQDKSTILPDLLTYQYLKKVIIQVNSTFHHNLLFYIFSKYPQDIF